MAQRRALISSRSKVDSHFDRRLIGAVLICAFVNGCVRTEFANPIAVLVDRKASYGQRRAAAAQAKRDGPHDPKRTKALEDLLWQPKYPAWQRKYSIDELIELDERAFRDTVARRFVLLRDWDTINHVFDHAIERNWMDFTPVAVRNFSRRSHGVADSERPERRVIQALNPGRTIEEVVFEVFSGADEKTKVSEQVAAWELLTRLTDTARLMDWLRKAPDATPLVIDLKAASAFLKVLPRNKEGVLWLQTLRDPSYRELWDRAAAAVERLEPRQRHGLELRHLSVLLQLKAQTMNLSREELLSQLADELRRVERHLEGPTYDGPLRDWPQKLNHWHSQLNWADLATIRLVRRMMGDRQFVAQLFRQAERDRRDVSTEYGGVIDIVDGRAKAIGFEPQFREHDLKFIPSDKMIVRLYTAIAHYHFHAQRLKNRSFAGPGQGDLRLADRIDANYLVFTFIAKDQLNVDYYQHGGVVIDLGIIVDR